MKLQRVLSEVRKAVDDYHMIAEGDKIAVGISGGKDSLVLLNGLALLRRFIGIEYELVAITLDPRFNGQEGDYSSVQELCDKLGVEYRIIPTDIGEIIFNIRKEPNPCSLCARMRRGALHDASIEAGCNKLALGHHYNDAVETFVMNLFNEGRIGCFSPKTYLSKKDIWLIRPMVLTSEKEIFSACRRNGLEVVKSKCPVDGHTNREKTKNFLAEMEKESRGFTYRLFGAMRRANIDGWGGVNYKPDENKDN